MSRTYQFIVVLFLFAALAACVKPDLPEKQRTQLQRTQLGLYLTITEAYDLVKKDAKNILFIDVRTPAEITKLGMPSLADANVPILLVRNKKKVFNKDFVSGIEERLEEKGLDKQSTIVLICREGNRSAKAADALAKVGYKRVYHVIEGTNGWKSSNLPWSDPDDISPEKMYL